MDVFIVSVTICCSAAALIYLWRILNWVWFRPRKLEKILRRQGFNGNPYKLFYGDLKEIGAAVREAVSKPMNFSNDIAHRAIPIYHNAAINHGENNIVWFGPRPVVSITDPEMIREIMSKNYVFQKPSTNPLARMAKGLALYEEDKWAKHRKLINPAFHVEKLKHMVPSFYLSCEEMLSKWEKLTTAANNGRCEVDVWPHLQTMTSDIISRTAFGSSYEEGRKTFQLQNEQARLVMEATRSTYIPGSRFLPTKFNRRMKEIVGEIKSSLLPIIEKRTKDMEAGEASKDDLLGLLLESNFKEIKQYGNESGMSMEEVIEECKLFYFAGQETTASLLVWTMILLGKHPDWQARARDEILQVFGTEKPDYQQLNHLKVVNMILREALRLYPSGVVLSRLTHKEARLGKLIIPAGVQLVVPLLSVHRDRRFWGDSAMEFDPERFGEGVSSATQGQLRYFPFGWGPRICIGQNFAMLEAKIAMAMILQSYSFEVSPAYTHAPHKVITLQPQHGAHLILTKLP